MSWLCCSKPTAISKVRPTNYGGTRDISELQDASQKDSVIDLVLPDPNVKSLCDVRRSIFLLVMGTSCLYSAVNATMSIVNSIASETSSLPATTFLVYGFVQVVNSVFASLYTEYCRSQKALLAAMVALLLYITCNVYISWWTFIAGASLLGFGYSLQWISGNIYCSEIGNYYAELLETDNKIILVRMFGIFNAAVQSGFLWGSIIVYFIFHGDSHFHQQLPNFDMNMTGEYNETFDGFYECHLCGPAFKEEYSNRIPQLQRPSQIKLYILSAIFITLSISGCGMVAALDSFRKFHAPRTYSCKELASFLKNLFRNVLDWQKLLLCPLTVFIGMEQGFIMTEFTEAFVACCTGISNIGLVMMCFGLLDTCFCLLQELLVRLCGRRVVIASGIISGIGALVIMLLWKPNPHAMWMYYLLSALWAIMDSILITQVFAIYSILFGDDANSSFSVAIFWVSMGFLIPFSYSLYLLEWTKLIIMVFILSIGTIGYFFVELKLLR